jgi:hypothetical protein
MEQHDDATRKPHREQQAQADTKISVERGEKGAPMGHEIGSVSSQQVRKGSSEVYRQENFRKTSVCMRAIPAILGFRALLMGARGRELKKEGGR